MSRTSKAQDELSVSAVTLIWGRKTSETACTHRISNKRETAILRSTINSKNSTPVQIDPGVALILWDSLSDQERCPH